jgi:DNA-binding transcriptional ArsR family regulator
MPKYSAEPPLVSVFRALADPTRLSVIERLSISPASATELSRPFDMALPSFMQHLQILEDADLVMSHKSGRTRTYQLQPETLNSTSAWFVTFRNHWDRRMDQLEELLLPRTPPSKPKSAKQLEQESQ